MKRFHKNKYGHLAPQRTAEANQCYGKHAYSTEKAAWTVAEMKMQERPETPLRTYQCRVCHLWHLTHKPFRQDLHRS